MFKFLFPKIKSALNGICFEAIPEVKKKTIKLLRQPAGEDLRYGPDQWKTTMQWGVVADGEYIEGERN